MKVLLIIVLVVVGAAVVALTDKLFGITLVESFGSSAAFAHNIELFLIGVAARALVERP